MIKRLLLLLLARLLAPVILVAAAVACLLFASCREEKKPAPPVIVEAPDYTPIGEGWKLQSYALIGISVIITVGLLARSGSS